MVNSAGSNDFLYALGFTRYPNPGELDRAIRRLKETGRLRSNYFNGLATSARLNGIPAEERAMYEDLLKAFKAELPADVIKPKKQTQLTVVGVHA